MSKQSFIDKIIDFGMKDESFKNDSGETINYVQPFIILEIDGEHEEIILSGASAPKPKMLRLALKSAKSHKKKAQLLDDDEE